MKEIYHSLWVDAPRARVYSALTEKEGIAGWWTGDLDYEGSIGSIATFRFKSGAFNKMKVKALESHKIDWECVDGQSEWIGTQISFELQEVDHQTRVSFAHYGWKAQTQYTAECSFHWAYYLMKLQEFCEK